MKLLQFFVLIIRRGTLFLKPQNFKEEQLRIVDAQSISGSITPHNEARGLKSKLLRTPIGYSILANLAYLKNASSMNKMLLVSDTQKVVYIRILKAASTSVLKVFLPLVDSKIENFDLSDQQYDILGFHYSKRKLLSDQSAFSKFTIVRNPFNRIVSVYLDLFDAEATSFTYAAYWFGILKKNMSFEDFIITIRKIPVFLLGPHFAPQHYILKSICDLKDVSIFRLEKDMEHLTTFLNRYTVNLPHLNKKASYDYHTYYNSELLDVVGKMYEDDILIFNYQEDLEDLRQFVLSR